MLTSKPDFLTPVKSQFSNPRAVVNTDSAAQTSTSRNTEDRLTRSAERTVSRPPAVLFAGSAQADTARLEAVLTRPGGTVAQALQILNDPNFQFDRHALWLGKNPLATVIDDEASPVMTNAARQSLLSAMLEKGADINAGASHQTPLFALMKKTFSAQTPGENNRLFAQQKPMFQFLLDNGADPDPIIESAAQYRRVFGQPGSPTLKGVPECVTLLKKHSFQYSDPLTSDAKGFDGIIGLNKVKRELQLNFIRPLMKRKHPEQFKKTNVKIKPAQGLLLYGKPGTGKSFIARKLADELEMNTVFAKASDLEGAHRGHSQKKIEELFDRAAAQKPCLLIIDEFDQIATRIAQGGYEDTSWNDTKRAAILVELQRAAERGIIVVGTTNKHPSALDAATIREQRIDVHIRVPLPDRKARVGLFKMYISENMDAPKFPFTRPEIESLAADTEGFSSATIQTLCETAARKADLDDSDWDLKYLQIAIREATRRPKPSTGLSLDD